jgi:MOSC domain-containing protein YiiM
VHPYSNVSGRVASLHRHPARPGDPFSEVSSIRVVTAKGIEGNPRYFGRISQNGTPGRRQVTLIERSQIIEHADKLGLKVISPGAVRSNIETDGINLIDLIGQKVQIGSAILFFYEPRLPCAKMDAICNGLRKLMENNKQGVLAQVIASGTIAVGDRITLCDNQLSGELGQ